MDWNDLTQYRCQKHGDIGTQYMKVEFGAGSPAPQTFHYCLLCFNEMIAKHCHQAVAASPPEASQNDQT